MRNKREQLGISLDELQAKTKIRKRYLIALEDETGSCSRAMCMPEGLYAATQKRLA